MEEKLLNGEPIVEVEKQPILKWVNDKLSLEKCLPEPKIVPSPVKEIIPAQLKHSIPGAAPAVKDLAADFVAERGSSTIKSFSLVKEKEKSAEQPAAKKKTKQSKKKVVVNGNSSAKSSTKPAKRPYTKKTQKVVIEKKVPVPLLSKKEIAKNECCYDSCGKKWSERKNSESERWIECCKCNRWACDICANIKQLDKETVDKIKFSCKNCRNN